jgi:hypothetical protein
MDKIKVSGGAALCPGLLVCWSQLVQSDLGLQTGDVLAAHALVALGFFNPEAEAGVVGRVGGTQIYSVRVQQIEKQPIKVWLGLRANTSNHRGAGGFSGRCISLDLANCHCEFALDFPETLILPVGGWHSQNVSCRVGNPYVRFSLLISNSRKAQVPRTDSILERIMIRIVSRPGFIHGLKNGIVTTKLSNTSKRSWNYTSFCIKIITLGPAF